MAAKDGWRLPVRLTPRAAKDEVSGVLHGPDGLVLAVRVRAVPEKGKANAALTALVANWLDLPKSAVRLAAGGKSRQKMLEIDGEASELQLRIAEAISKPFA